MKLKPVFIRTMIYAAIGLALTLFGLFKYSLSTIEYLFMYSRLDKLLFGHYAFIMLGGLALILFALLTFLFRKRLAETPHIITSVLTVLTSAALSYYILLRIMAYSILTGFSEILSTIPEVLVFLLPALPFIVAYWILRIKRFKKELVVYDGLTFLIFLIPFINLGVHIH